MTELIWDGTYDKNGRRVAPVRVALPFQTVETVDRAIGTERWQVAGTGRDISRKGA